MFALNVGRVNTAVMLHARSGLRLAELAKAADLPRQIVASALSTLEKKGIVRRSRVGDHDVFSADTRSPYFLAAYLTAIVDLPVAAALGSRRALACYLYGSLATPGTARAVSDVDLLVVGDFRDKADVREALSPIGERLERRIDAFVLTPEQLDEGIRSDDAHIRAALAGVRIFGQV